MRPRDRPGGRSEAVVVAAELEVSGRATRRAPSAAAAVGELGRARDIGSDIVGGVGLDEGDAKGFGVTAPW